MFWPNFHSNCQFVVKKRKKQVDLCFGFRNKVNTSLDGGWRTWWSCCSRWSSALVNGQMVHLNLNVAACPLVKNGWGRGDHGDNKGRIEAPFKQLLPRPCGSFHSVKNLLKQKGLVDWIQILETRARFKGRNEPGGHRQIFSPIEQINPGSRFTQTLIHLAPSWFLNVSIYNQHETNTTVSQRFLISAQEKRRNIRSTKSNNPCLFFS